MIMLLSDIYSADYRATHPVAMKYAAENTILQHYPEPVVPDGPGTREEALTKARTQIAEIHKRVEAATAAAAVPDGAAQSATDDTVLAKAMERQRKRWRQALDMLADR